MIKTLLKTIVLLVLFASSIALNLYFYLNPQYTYSYTNSTTQIYYSTKTKTELEVEMLESTTKTPKSDIYVTGWIPDWDLNDGLETLTKQASTFGSISPFWLMPQEDGSIEEVANNANPRLISLVKSKGIKLIPTVPLFDFEVLSKILNNPVSFQRHIDEILQRVDNYNYDGIDLDYESIALTDKKIFYEFLSKLSGEMKKRNKTLVFTALPKWGDEITYPSLPQTRLVQDYKMLSEYVDELRIMTYDFFGRTSTEAGPIAPLEWIERVIQYAIAQGVPREKIVLGVHTYAYDWSDRPITPAVDLVNWYGNLADIEGLEPGNAYYFGDVESVINDYSMRVSFDSTWGEAIGRYTYKGKERIVIFPNQESIDLRKNLAKEYGIKGIAIWRIGDDGSLKY